VYHDVVELSALESAILGNYSAATRIVVPIVGAAEARGVVHDAIVATLSRRRFLRGTRPGVPIAALPESLGKYFRKTAWSLALGARRRRFREVPVDLDTLIILDAWRQRIERGKRTAAVWPEA